MAEDTGIKAKAIDSNGVLVSTKIGNFGSRQLSIYNSGSNYIYANINSSVAEVTANVTAGVGAVPIANGSSHCWKHPNIVNVAICTASGESSTCDIACVSEAL